MNKIVPATKHEFDSMAKKHTTHYACEKMYKKYVDKIMEIIEDNWTDCEVEYHLDLKETKKDLLPLIEKIYNSGVKKGLKNAGIVYKTK